MKKLFCAIFALSLSTMAMSAEKTYVVKVKEFVQHFDSEYGEINTNKGTFYIMVSGLSNQEYKTLKNAAKQKSCIKLIDRRFEEGSYIYYPKVIATKCPTSK